MEEYLNAKSMATPGFAGGLVMLISNTCATQFDIRAKWAALILSALLGLLVVGILTAPFWQKAILWFFNSLIIFTMAVSTNVAGATISQASKPNPEPLRLKSPPDPEPLLLKSRFAANILSLSRPAIDYTSVLWFPDPRPETESTSVLWLPESTSSPASWVSNFEPTLYAPSVSLQTPSSVNASSKDFFHSWFN